MLSLSGAAALIYQVVWFRSLTLVFGGSHLAVTVVAVSMSRASIMFVDNRAKVVYGQQYVNDYAHGEVIQWFVDDVMTAVRGTYQTENRGYGPIAESFPRSRKHTAEDSRRRPREDSGSVNQFLINQTVPCTRRLI